jgi:sodium transport system permease protein
VPVSFCFSALFLAVAAFARDFKDGQNALTPLYVPVLLVSGVTALPGFELSPWTAFVPVINVALLIKALFVGEAPADLVFLVLLASALWAALALLLAARVFARENVLLGGKESLRSLLAPVRVPGGVPGAGLALTLFAGVLVASFYGGLLVEHASMAVQLVVIEYGFFLAPVLAAVALFRLSPRATLALRAPSLRAVVGGLLIGASSWTLAVLSVRLVPPPRELVDRLGDAILVDARPFPVVVLLIAVTPAICEEMLFRGFVFGGLRRHGPAVAVLVSAALFAFAHGSIYRMLPTFLLGVGMGWARYRSGSIVPGILIHTLNNGLVAALLFFRPAWATEGLERGALPLWLIGAGAAVLALGVLALPRPEGEGAVGAGAR